MSAFLLHAPSVAAVTASRSPLPGCLVCLLLGIGSSIAQATAPARPIYLDRFDHDAGLSQLAVNAIAQDATGFLWIGTEDGLDRFDGYSFQHESGDPSGAGPISGRYIAAVQADSRRNLYVATDGLGVGRLDLQTGKFESIATPAQINSMGLARVRTAYLDRAGTLWIGTRNDGLVRFDPKSKQLDRFVPIDGDRSSLGGNGIHAILEDSKGILWVGTGIGLSRLDRTSGAFLPQPLPLPDTTQVSALLQDRHGDLWVGTSRGLVRRAASTGESVLYAHDSANARSLPDNTVNAILEDANGRLWVGTARGLALLDRRTGQFDTYVKDRTDPRSLPDDNIVSLFEDRSGLLWIGTQFGGLAKWNPRAWSFGHHPARAEAGFASNRIMGFTETPDRRLWVATFDGGITVVDPQSGRTSAIRNVPGARGSISDDRVMALLTDHEGVVWAGTMGGGLNRIAPDTGQVTVYRHDANDARSLGAEGVMSLLEDSQHRLWIGTYGGGLSRFDRERGDFQRYSSDARGGLGSDRVTAMAEDSSGRIWIGTDGGGLSILDPVSGRFQNLRHDPESAGSLHSDTVYCIHVDRKGRTWVGTRGGGLSRVTGSATDPSSIRFARLTERDGLPNNTVYGIQSDSTGMLWVGTNYGLARVNPETRAIHAFHRSAGLQGEEFNFGADYASASGALYFGGNNGYNAFVPANLEYSRSPPPVVLTSVHIAKREPIAGAQAAGLSDLHLGYRDDDMTLEVAALDFEAPLFNRFRYQLNGAGWVDIGSRHTISYSDLPGGDYTLRVQAANSDGIWNTRGAVLRLHVAPPPWLSTTAYMLYALFALIAVVAIWMLVRMRLVRDAKQRAQLELLVRERTAEIEAHVTALAAANRQLEQVSSTDPLTGLGNRRSLQGSLPRMIAKLAPGSRLAIMIVDLDRLKPINDEFGHEAGDRVLKTVSTILREALLPDDIIARWGGDEFVVVHRCDHLNDSAEFAERVRRAVSRHRYSLRGPEIARTSCSIGLAMYPFVPGKRSSLTWEDVLQLADGALYRAKIRRNAWVALSGRIEVRPDMLSRIAADPDTAHSEGIIDLRNSSVTTGETIELMLRQPRLSSARG